MSAHPDGSGSSWTEDIDADQPAGLDYRALNDLRIGIRKRLAFEHVQPADSTVGGIHKPGGTSALGIEDGTATILADGTLKGHGIVWDNTSRIWCSTAVAGATVTGDWTLILINPNKQWGGGDVTWEGEHHFDASVDFDCTAVVFNGDVSIVEHLACGSDCEVAGDFSVDGTADFGDAVAIIGEVSIDASVSVGGDVAFVSDVSIDGTLAVQDMVLTGDSTFTFDPIAGETGPTFKMLGDWSSKSANTQYLARTDGFVCVYKADNGSIRGKTDAANPPLTVRTAAQRAGSAGVDYAGLSFPVEGGAYWEVSCSAGAADVYWIPLGDNT